MLSKYIYKLVHILNKSFRAKLFYVKERCNIISMFKNLTDKLRLIIVNVNVDFIIKLMRGSWIKIFFLEGYLEEIAVLIYVYM